MKDLYEDIINLPHHVSSKRPQMPMLDRAAQFSPFAALTGYDDAIHETGRLTDEKIDLSEEEKEALDRKQQILMERLGDHPALTVTYFVPDAKKSGGAYVTKSGNLKKIDGFERWILLTDGTKIPLDDVADAAQIHLKGVAGEQAAVAAADAQHTHTLVDGRTDNRPHSRVHARSVAAAGQHTNRFDLLFHGKIPSNCFVIYLWSTNPLSLGTSSIALLRS